MLSCREITEVSSRYLDQDLTFGTRMQVRMHLLVCKHCRRFVGQLRRTIDLVRRVGAEPRPVELEEALIAEYRARAISKDRHSSPADVEGHRASSHNERSGFQ